MNVEKTMEFILEQQAQFEANFAKAELRFVQAEKRLDRIERLSAQNNHLVARLAGYGVSLRSDIRRHEKAIAAAHTRAEDAHARAEEARRRAEAAGAEAKRVHAEAQRVHAKTDAQLKSLAATVERFIRRNGK